MEGPRNPFNRESVLSITLSPATWTRIVTELICANGLLSRGPFLRIRDLLQALRALSISNPVAVTLMPEDAVVTDPFDRPAAAQELIRSEEPGTRRYDVPGTRMQRNGKSNAPLPVQKDTDGILGTGEQGNARSGVERRGKQ